MEFWDFMKNKYDWENEYLYMSDGTVKVKPVDQYHHIPAEIPGVLMESDLRPDEGALKANPIPTMSYVPETACANSVLAPTPIVSQTTGL